MDIEFKGGNCVTVTVKKTVLSVDPKLKELGLKDQGEKADVQLLTQPSFAAPAGEDTLIIDGPGEYEVENISIRGIAAQAHTEAKDEGFHATMYRVDAADLTAVIVGHINPDLTEEQLEDIGVIDVLVVPVGGNGYTLDATGAVQVIRALEPKVVIPTHYAESGVTYPIPQAELETFVKELGAAKEETSRLKLKSGSLPVVLTVFQVTRTS